MSFDKPVAVIDNGSFSIKAGFACDNHPVSIFRSVVGRPSYLNGSYGRQYYDVYIGDEAVERVEDLELSHPIERGRIVHWDNMERIWHHIFYRELKAAPEDRAVILACAASTTMEEKIRCCEVFFETLNVPGLCVQSQSALSLYGSGYTTGLSVDIGYDFTESCPVYEGSPMKYANMDTGLAGQQITNYIKGSFHDRNLDYGVRTPEIIDQVIRRCLYVTPDIAMSKKDYQKIIKLPSGEELDVSEESFMAAEMIFQPDLVVGGKSGFMPLQEAVLTSAMKCDAELRSQLFDAIIMCGGITMIPGLTDRLAAELEALTDRPINVVTSTEAYAVSWLGGATFASLPDSQKMWVLKKQYEDHGERIVRNKFLV